MPIRSLPPAPIRSRVMAARAFLLGVRDGWRQPRELSSSRNVEHLAAPGVDVFEAQDRGINAGQRLRSPRHHQRFD